MSTPTPLPPFRRFSQPRPGDDWASIAARELPDVAPDMGVEQLRSWNLHLVFRPVSVITPSDIIFVEAPPAAVA